VTLVITPVLKVGLFGARSVPAMRPESSLKCRSPAIPGPLANADARGDGLGRENRERGFRA
jgi:hypothetical protein